MSDKLVELLAQATDNSDAITTIKVKYKEQLYDISREPPVKDDLVLDKRDCCIGICQFVLGSFIAIRSPDDTFAGLGEVEIGVPIDRVYKLVKFTG